MEKLLVLANIHSVKVFFITRMNWNVAGSLVYVLFCFVKVGGKSSVVNMRHTEFMVSGGQLSRKGAPQPAVLYLDPDLGSKLHKPKKVTEN